MRRLFLLLALAAAAWGHTPVIVLNNSTGSDTTASGAPSGFGPFSAAATCDTNGVGSTVIDWVANPLAGVPTDGSAVLWLATASGRRFSEITARATDTVTVEDSFNIPGASPVDCAVGGKRATITATRLWDDLKGKHGATGLHGWTIQLENTGANYTTAVELVIGATTNGCVVRGAAGTRPIIESTANITTLDPKNCDIEHLQWINTSGTKTTAFALRFNSNNSMEIADNIFGGSSTAQGFEGCCTRQAVSQPSGPNFWNNEIRFNVVGYSGGAGYIRFAWNYVHDNTTGVEQSNCSANVNFGGGLYFRNLIVNNTGDGVRSLCLDTPTHLIENVIDGNTGDGVDLAINSRGFGLVGNQITNNGGFGVRCDAGVNDCESLIQKQIVAFNNFFGNSSGARQNWPVGESETAVNPNYVDRPNKNWCITGVNQGGPPGAGQMFPGSNTGSFLDRGACQRSGAGAQIINLGI